MRYMRFSLGLAAVACLMAAETSGAGGGDNSTQAETTSVDKVPEGGWLYRHKTIRRWRSGEFEFKNHELRLTKKEENDRFIELLNDLPQAETIDIVRVNEQAVAASESSVVRGAHGADDILTAKDAQRIADATNGGVKPTQATGLSGLIKPQ